MDRNKSKLVRVIGVVELIRSVYLLIVGFLGFGILAIFTGYYGLTFWSAIGKFRGDIGDFLTIGFVPDLIRGITIIMGITGFIGAIALIRYKPIGRKLVIIVAIFMIINSLIQLIETLLLDKFLNYNIAFWFYFIIIFPIIYYVAMIFYLMTSEVKNSFESN